MLVIEGVTKAFGGLVALDEVSFQVQKGELVGLIGPNGSGKTTLFEVVSGFYRPTSGQVLFKGERIDGLKPHQVCQRGIARSFQLVESFSSLTAYETVLVAALARLPMAEARKRTEEILELLGVAARAQVPVPSLNLADRKALEVGKILALKPEMVLLDEVMAGLSMSEATAIVALIRRLRQNEGMTWLIVEHRMEIIMDLCERIVVLNFGRKIAEGTPHEIVNNKEVTESYLGSPA